MAVVETSQTEFFIAALTAWLAHFA